MDASNLTYRDKEIALSSLLRRDREDPGAAELLVDLMHDPDETIRKRAVSISDRFVQHRHTVEGLLHVAADRNEQTHIRIRSLEQLEVLFDSARSCVSTKEMKDQVIDSVKRGSVSILQNPETGLKVRGQALQLCAYFLSVTILREWIFWLYNQPGIDSRVSSISAMGRSGDDHWEKYIQGFLDAENIEFTCAALEAIAERELPPEDRVQRKELNVLRSGRSENESTLGN